MVLIVVSPPSVYLHAITCVGTHMVVTRHLHPPISLSDGDGQGSFLEILALVGRRYVPLVGYPHFLSGPLLMGQSTGTVTGSTCSAVPSAAATSSHVGSRPGTPLTMRIAPTRAVRSRSAAVISDDSILDLPLDH